MWHLFGNGTGHHVIDMQSVFSSNSGHHGNFVKKGDNEDRAAVGFVCLYCLCGKNAIWISRNKDYMENTKKRNKGSATIEMAFIMPILISIFIMLIYLSGYLYNRQSIEAIACIASHKGLQMEHDTTAAVQNEIENYINNELKNKLIFSPKTSFQVEVGMRKIHIAIEMEQTIPFANLSEFAKNNSRFQTKTVRKADRIDPAAILWLKVDG